MIHSNNVLVFRRPLQFASQYILVVPFLGPPVYWRTPLL